MFPLDLSYLYIFQIIIIWILIIYALEIINWSNSQKKPPKNSIKKEKSQIWSQYVAWDRAPVPESV